jgi:Flp pilus assembly protein TadD
MRLKALRFYLALFTAVCCCSADLGCHSSDDQAASNNTVVSGDVAKNAALARSDTDRAFRLLQKGDYGGAEPILNRAVAADPTYGPAQNDLGLIYFQQNELYKAAWEFENASKLMPAEPQPQNNLGLVLEKAGKFPEAQKAYERACELDPENAEFAGNLASLRIRQGMRDETTNRLLQLIIERDSRPDWVDWARFNLIRNSPSTATPPPATPGWQSPP